MIQTMKQFYSSLELLGAHADEMISVFDLIEIIDLRLRRLEDQAGIPMPDDLVMLRKRLGS